MPAQARIHSAASPTTVRRRILIPGSGFRPVVNHLIYDQSRQKRCGIPLGQSPIAPLFSRLKSLYLHLSEFTARSVIRGDLVPRVSVCLT